MRGSSGKTEAKPEARFIVEPAIFDSKIAPLMKTALREAVSNGVVDSSSAETLSNKFRLRGLNRRSYSSNLRKLCRFAGLSVETRELRQYVEFRNKLVHYGRFYCDVASDEEREKVPALEDKWSEYLLLMSLLDRILLRLLAYEGRFFDRRNSGVVG